MKQIRIILTLWLVFASNIAFAVPTPETPDLEFDDSVSHECFKNASAQWGADPTAGKTGIFFYACDKLTSVAIQDLSDSQWLLSEHEYVEKAKKRYTYRFPVRKDPRVGDTFTVTAVAKDGIRMTYFLTVGNLHEKRPVRMIKTDFIGFETADEAAAKDRMIPRLFKEIKN